MGNNKLSKTAVVLIFILCVGVKNAGLRFYQTSTIGVFFAELFSVNYYFYFIYLKKKIFWF